MNYRKPFEVSDSFDDDDEPFERSVDALAARGVTLPDGDTLSDEAVPLTLWRAIEVMAELGLFLESTDHLNDRQLYRWLRQELERRFLPAGIACAWHLSPVEGDDGDFDAYLRYYADDDVRRAVADIDPDIPPKERPQYDRDRLLPKHDGRNCCGRPWSA